MKEFPFYGGNYVDFLQILKVLCTVGLHHEDRLPMPYITVRF